MFRLTSTSSHGLSAHKALTSKHNGCNHTAYILIHSINIFCSGGVVRRCRDFKQNLKKRQLPRGRDEVLSSRRIRPIRLIGPIVQPIGAYQQAHPACPAYTGSLQGNHPKTKTTAVRNARRQHNELVKRERVVKQAKAHEPRQRSLRLQSTWL